MNFNSVENLTENEIIQAYNEYIVENIRITNCTLKCVCRDGRTLIYRTTATWDVGTYWQPCSGCWCTNAAACGSYNNLYSQYVRSC